MGDVRTLTFYEVTALIGRAGIRQFCLLLRALGVTDRFVFRRASKSAHVHEWQGVDWGQSSEDIARAMGVRHETVATYRTRCHTGTDVQQVRGVSHRWCRNYRFCGARLREWRTRRGWSQAQMQEWMGVSRNMFTSWERGHREPNGTHALQLCLLLNCHPRDLCQRDEREWQ